ncbi:ABC transporter ATP-binding protein [Alicyclobacillus dauci]|uniref:ABC transporter ATP-binding protein n=1 Tax=Alicyclobacillus dauci TaxID=1475485 RepID=A0ABY6Z1L8_9BACL|nr:ABC transporter ATP-binding protein [Alicyclobacillus dauci]WAH36640.1 ABC transporter ATP-binding protein [Alicyclobacillus dauci]
MLQIKDLKVHFPTQIGTVQAVRGLDLTLEEGKTLSIVGESGSGKSVAVQSVMRLLPSHAKISGEILWNGKNLLGLAEKQMQSVRGREIGMIFQDPMTSLNPTMKVGHQIAESILQHERMSAKKAVEKAVELLDLVGIPDPRRRAASYPHQFSGGMRQRAVIAIAIACSPRLLIADEPTTALDVTVQAQILELLKDLQKQMGMALLLITHDLAVVGEVADEVAVMYAGKPIEYGPVEDVLHRPTHPYTQGLLRSRPIPGSREPLISIPGTPPDLLNPPQGCAFASRCPHAMRICKDYQPDVETIDNKQVACWLLHPQAKETLGWNSYSYKA